MPAKKTLPERKKLKPMDDLFGLDEESGQIIEAKLSELYPFRNHPFKVLDDEKMQQMIESVKENGVIVPGLVRERDGGGYELISGHRRKHAAEIAGLTTMPVIVKELTDDEAVVEMVDANLQREEILPSEKAFAYKMKLEAIKHQGKRNDLTSGQVVSKYKRSTEEIAEGTGESYKQIQRYIRLTELLPELLDLTDRKKLKFNPAVELSYLKQEEQRILLEEMDKQETVPSLYQAQQIKRLSSDSMCTKEAIHAILVVAPIKDRSVTIKEDKIMQFFSSDISNEEIEKIIYQLLEEWSEGKRKGA